MGSHEQHLFQKNNQLGAYYETPTRRADGTVCQ